MDRGRCVFFDRDGVVNEPPVAARYILRWDEFRLIPAFAESVRIAEARGYDSVIVTNQRAVALGLITAEAIDDIHRRLRRLLQEAYGVTVLDIGYCPHDEGQCECRKPKPGLLLEMARRHGLSLPQCWMIGDAETDMEAGRSAGCRTVLVTPSEGRTLADFTVSLMSRLPDFLRLHLK